MASYKNILKQIVNMEQRLCIDDPCEILDDILNIAKAPFVLEKERNRKRNLIDCQNFRERHRKEYNERHKLWQREYYKKKKEQQ